MHMPKCDDLKKQTKKWVALFALVAMAGCAHQPAPSVVRVAKALPDKQTYSARQANAVAALACAATVASITPAMQADVQAHRARYPDTVGWLIVPGTTIDAAVMQSDDLTNEYYLQHDLDGNPDKNGTYSVDTLCRMSPGRREGMSANTTVFAHNHDDNPDGILFAQLKKFNDPDFARRTPYIYFAGTEEDMAWEVFAVFNTVKQFDYIAPDPTPRRLGNITGAAIAASIYDYGIEIGPEDKILTLSTCSFDVPGVGKLPITEANDYRFVVMARLVSPDEPLREAADIIARDDFMMPDEFLAG